MVPTFLIARLSSSFAFTHRNSTRAQLGCLLQHSAFLFFNAFCSSGTISESESQTNHHKGHTFTVSYLINSCGLSPDLALKLSKRVNLRNPDGPNAVLDLLKNYGFSKTQLSLLVKGQPTVLSANPEKTLLPKLQFYNSIGVSSTELPKILIRNTILLAGSLSNFIIPRYEILRSVLRNEEEVVAALKHLPRSFTCRGVIDDLLPNTKVLRQFGVPQACISLLVCNHLNVACMEHSKFVEAAKKAKEMGFEPWKTSFVVAVKVFTKMNKAMWKSQLKVFERWGWSTNMSLLAFLRYPQCMLMSENKIMKTMSFLVKDMGWPSEEIARTPGVLSPNLEKTIIPRCTVAKVLKSKGLIKKDLSIGYFILRSEKFFLKRFVTQYQENVPFLLEVYKGQIDHLDIL